MRKTRSGFPGTWRIPFSADVKNRRRQKAANRRPHRLGAALGEPEMHWTQPGFASLFHARRVHRLRG